jgi:hypothetical protein
MRSQSGSITGTKQVSVSDELQSVTMNMIVSHSDKHTPDAEPPFELTVEGRGGYECGDYAEGFREKEAAG